MEAGIADRTRDTAFVATSLGRAAPIESSRKGVTSRPPNEAGSPMRFDFEPGENGRIRAIRLLVGTR